MESEQESRQEENVGGYDEVSFAVERSIMSQQYTKYSRTRVVDHFLV